jgi:hypothetical protein
MKLESSNYVQLLRIGKEVLNKDYYTT